MMMMVIMRGLPGSGKSHCAATLLRRHRDAVVVSADDYFVGNDGVYRFVGAQIAQAHERCRRNARAAAEAGRTVIVDNTNSREWEYIDYINIAREFGMKIHIMDLGDGGMSDEELAARNSHGVPVAAIARMRARWESAWADKRNVVTSAQ